MATIIEALETLAAKGWWKEWQNPAWKQFILTGDEKQLKKLPKFTEHSWLPPELLSALPAPSQIDDSGKRFLQACCVAEHPQAIGNWIQQRTMRDGAANGEFAHACALLIEIGCPTLFLAQQVAENAHPLSMLCLI
jgi:hypothetical protein